ncbi:ATP-binding protein [Catenulispora yoronensis]|uniref:ATP-binding protein n=1 Tax=Catenulispora yoronensis TaxID=450799 RepID=A0ABN2UPB5_9ACTN
MALLVPLGFQVGVLPAAALVSVGGFGLAGNRSVLAVGAFLMAATAALGYGMARGIPVRAVLVGDTVLAVVANLVVSAWSPPSDRAAEVSWQYFAGSVALVTLARGVRGGLAVVAGGIPLRLAMFAASGPERTVRSAAVLGLGDAAVSVLAMAMAAGVLVALDRDAERLRAGIRRSLHDTVLQTLEAIALTLPNDSDAEQAPRRLREVRAIAHAEAVALRRELARRGARTTPDLMAGLVGLVGELAREGLRVRLDAVDAAHDGLTPARRTALLAATREALRNVLKHSGTAEALIRVGAADPAHTAELGGLTLTVRDFGVGFDPSAHRPGFGLSESVAARMREVSGTARVGARPGHGVSVTLWVPVERDVGS